MTTDINYVEIKEVREIIKQWDEAMRTFPVGYALENYCCDPEFLFLRINILEYLSVWKKFKEGAANRREQLISHEIAMYLACDNKTDKPDRPALMRKMSIDALIKHKQMKIADAIKLVAERTGRTEETVRSEYYKRRNKDQRRVDRENRTWLREDAHPSFRDLIMSAVERKKWYVFYSSGDYLPVPPVAE
ncbi:hypothetical protein ACXIUH_22005 [Vibrio parahaemolyticus]|uniref:hypothetical protein n=1 Tax=Vibrio parahaemolyticus TaxID=670 RepID=UPI001F2A8B67|nr:hypothetical protein [Vibrio parahaemolyticus]MCG0014434.1 hypothetical protein [Vibrio parahaemolyticus]MDF4891240.1 hypothetical protein [Vibrio parahaemolyticus]MDL2000141.1 hypothetical protein [Vibrio parahaemolyticus]